MSGANADAIVLAGGSSRRMQGEDKLQATIGDATALERVVARCVAACDGRVVVCAGPEPGVRVVPGGDRIETVADDPGIRGPVAGVRAAQPLVSAPIVMLVAGDMPLVTSDLLTRLIDGCRDAPDVAAVVAVDSEGQRQYACCAWRTEQLARAICDLEQRTPAGRGIALRALMQHADDHAGVVELQAADDHELLDVDDPDDLRLVRSLARDRPPVL